MNQFDTAIFKRQSYIFVCVLLMIGVAITVTWHFLPLESQKFSAPPEAIAVGEVVQEQSESIPEAPVRLVIPAIDVDAPVQYVGLAEDGTGEMAVPSNFTDVGWYEPGVRPGMKGSAVIAGHYNGIDTPRAVFYDLEKLQVGDEVVIMSAERVENIFVVVKVATYDHNAPTEEVFVSADGIAKLNLITCGGTWLSEENVYDKRTVVFTQQLVNVD